MKNNRKKDRLLLDQYQEKIRYIMEDRELKEAWDWQTTLEKFCFLPPDRMGIPEPGLEAAFAEAETLLQAKPDFRYAPPQTLISIRKLGRKPVMQNGQPDNNAAAASARRMARTLCAHPDSDIFLRASCASDGNTRMDFMAGSGSLSPDALAAMIRGTYGRVEYESVDVSPKDYPINCWAAAAFIAKDKQRFERREDREQEPESWVTAVLASLACGKNYTVEIRFHPLLEKTEKDYLKKLTEDLERSYQELAFYSEVGWNNGINGGGNISMKISALHNLFQNLHFLRNVTQDGIQAGENYSFSYGKNSKIVRQHAIRLMGEIEYQLIKLRRIQNSVGWAVTISAAAGDEETIDAVTAIMSGAAERANISLKWRQNPCCAMIASNQDILPLLAFPAQEFAGFEFVENEEFALLSPDAEGMPIGKILWNGAEVSPFCLPRQALNRHAFICGMTGAGKTNTVFKIMEEIAAPFLVIEPVKGEYRSLLGKYSDMKIWTMRTSDALSEGVGILQINPFWFPIGANLSFHIDSIKTIISSAFDLSAAMPNIVEQCLYNLYLKSGWNIVTNSNIYWDILPEEYLYPTFSDFTNEVEAYLDKSEFGEEVLDNYKGALLSRLRSFTSGAKGALLNTAKHPDYASVMDGRTIIELEGLADDADKCLVMGTVLVQYYQYLKGHFQDQDKQKNLKHIIVIEEAHRLFKNVRPQGKGAEGPDPTGQLVESLGNIMAEIRAFGEGMLIVDQSPTKIAADVIKNSGTKIIHRIDHGEDIKMLQAAMLMRDRTTGFSALSQGEALIRSDAMPRPCKIRVFRSEIKESYSLAQSFRTGEMTDFAINDVFVANTILQEETAAREIEHEINSLFRSLVWTDWGDWYAIIDLFQLNIIQTLKDNHLYDRVQGRFQVVLELISAAVKRMFCKSGTWNLGLIHMFIMRLLAFFSDGRERCRVKPMAIEMLRSFFREKLCGILFPDMRKLMEDSDFNRFARLLGLEDEPERAYLLYIFLYTAKGGGLEEFLRLNTLLDAEKYREHYAELSGKLQTLPPRPDFQVLLKPCPDVQEPLHP